MRDKIILFIMICGVCGFGFALYYAFQQCGWGMLAYERPVIAAFTGECAQQIKLDILRELEG